MASLNSVMLIGNLTRDPDLRYTPKGAAVANVDIAINRNWKDESGEQKEEVTFVNCVAFGRTAEVCAQYLKKGSSVMVKGRLKLDSWDDKQTGQKRSKLGVVVEEVQFLGGKGAPEESQDREQAREFERPAFGKDAAGKSEPRRNAAPPAKADAETMPKDDASEVPF